jgi:hypothetical protein
MIWNLIGSIGGKVLDIVDNLVEDKDEANRLINPPAATIVNKGAQYDKSRFSASKFTMSDQTSFPMSEKRLD